MRKSVEIELFISIELDRRLNYSLLKVPDLVLFWLKEMCLRILKDWSGDSQSLKDFTKKQMSLSSSSVDNGTRLSIQLN